MLKGVASDKVKNNVERMLVTMLTTEGMFSPGDHVLLGQDVIDMIETGWPASRDSRNVSDPKFGAITARLWERLRAESLKAMPAR